MSQEAVHGIRYAAKLVTGRFGAQLVLVASTLIIPRYLGAVGYGQYAAWMAVIAILRSAVSLGLPMIEVRFLAPLWRLENREEAARLGSTIWLSKIGLAVLGGGAVFGWMVVSPELADGAVLALLLGVLACLNFVSEGTSSLFLPLGRVGSLSTFLVARSVLTLACVLLGHAWKGMLGVAGALVILQGLLALGTCWSLFDMAPVRVTKFSWPSLAAHLSFGLAVYVGTVAWAIQGQFSIFAVAKWATAEQAAYLG